MSNDPDPHRFDSAIEAFAQEDAAHPPPAAPVLFVGSSTFVGWKTLHSDLPSWPVLNRAFGGSQISDVLFFYDRVVRPYAPSHILFYCGDNDIGAGKSAERVLADFQEFVRLVRRDFPETPICFVSIKPSPARWSLWPEAARANALVESFCRASPRLRFLDVSEAMFGPDGRPRPELFIEDQLHMTSRGYELWARLVRGYLDRETRRA